MEDRANQMRLSSSSPSMETEGLPQSPTNQAEDEEEINVHLCLTSIVATPIRMKKSLTVRDLKEQICENYGFSEMDQHLFFSGQRLMDTETLGDCGIVKNSTIDLNVIQCNEKIQIDIKELTLDETILIVEAKLNDTIRNIKTVIENYKGYESERCTLMFEGKLLKDESTLESLQVEDGSTIDLVLAEKQEISIYVKEPNGDLLKLYVKTCFSVLDVKALAGRITGKPLSDWHLLFCGKLLKECRTLAYYAIVDGSVLDIYHRKVPIFVKTWTGKSITLRVEQDESVSDLKLKFFQKMKRLEMPRRTRISKLVYEGKELEDGENLSSYNIQKDSTILEH